MPKFTSRKSKKYPNGKTARLSAYLRGGKGVRHAKYNYKVILHRKRGEKPSMERSSKAEKELRRKYDLRYNNVRCKAYSVGSIVEFVTKTEGTLKGEIIRIHRASSGLVVYQISVINEESSIRQFAVTRQDIFRAVKA